MSCNSTDLTATNASSTTLPGVYGSGKDGDLTVNQPLVVNSVETSLTNSASIGASVLQVESAKGFNPSGGEMLLLIQMQNYTQSGGILPSELIYTSSVSGNTVNLIAGLKNNYNSVPNSFGSHQAQVTQLILVPQYRNVTVNSGGQMTAAPWNSTAGVGGLVVFAVSGQLTVNSGGLIVADGLGFTGGAPMAGGTCASNSGESWNGMGVPATSTTAATNNQGGGSGGKVSCSGVGQAGYGGSGQYASTTTTTLKQYTTGQGSPYGLANLANPAFVLGSGGGGGVHNEPQTAPQPGGSGGGGILIYANNLQVLTGGLISAKGAPGATDTTKASGDVSGSGSGGSILIQANSINLQSNNLINALGGAIQQDNGPPPASSLPYNIGGDGRIHGIYHTFTGSSTTAPPFVFVQAR